MEKVPQPVTLLIGTRKGAFALRSDGARKTWTLGEPWQFGCVVNHLVADPRKPGSLLMGVRTGHLGPTVMRSTDGGASWVEATSPPAFPKAPVGTKGRVVENVFWLAPSVYEEPGVWWAGTNPHGLFRSTDAGATWSEVETFSRYLGTLDPESLSAVPGGAFTHSILVDPRDPAHLYVSLSIGGTFETKDRGATWAPLNLGVAMDYAPPRETPYEVGHDPHCVVMHPAKPDRLYQQNHCGIYRIDRPKKQWVRIGETMPKEIGDIGFPVVVHPRKPNVAWVIPMDGTAVWPRTSVGGKPAVYRTRNGGKTWDRQDKGLPPENAWHTVKRQCFAADDCDKVGLYFGTTGGEVWGSVNEGGRWRMVASHLPEILSVEAFRS